MDKAVIDAAIEQALRESVEQGIKGKETTPFLLARVSELTGGDSLDSNIQLVFPPSILCDVVGKPSLLYLIKPNGLLIVPSRSVLLLTQTSIKKRIPNGLNRPKFNCV